MKYFIILLLISLFFSCVIQDVKTKPPKYEANESAHAIFFNAIKSGTNSGFKTKVNQLIKNQERFKIIWTKININFTSKEALPKIDFDKEMLVFVALGEQTSGGYAVKVDSVIENKKAIIINVTEIKPGKNCMTTSVMTYPYQIVALNKSKKEIVFKTIEQVYKCGK